MGIMVYSLVWVMQDFVHQPYENPTPPNYPLIYPKYPLLRAIRTLLKGLLGGSWT